MKKFIIGAIGGAAVGAVVSHFVTKRVLEEKINERVSQEYRELIAELKYGLVKAEDVVIHEVETDRPEPSNDDEEEEDAQTDYTKFKDKGVYVSDKPELEDFAKMMQIKKALARDEGDYPADLVEEAARVMEERAESDTHNLTPVREKGPYILEMSEFDTAYKNDKVSFTWWEGSQTLTDEDEEIIPDIDGVVGMRSLEAFGTELADPGDPDVVYIRNDRLGLDINLVRDPRNYFSDL